jgi:toxin ParE1/3/4
MVYEVITSKRAEIEIQIAIDYYSLINKNLPQRFIKSIEIALKRLSKNPYFEVKYLDIRSYNLTKFPFSLYFTVDSMNHIVNIRSCFHQSQNPIKRPNI